MRKGKIQLSIIQKIFLIPFIAILIGIVSIAYLSSVTVKKALLDEMKSTGVNMAENIIGRIEDNQEALKTINILLENEIFNVANMVINSEEDLSNEKLVEIASQLGVSQLHWFNNLGEVIYSNIDQDVGFQPPKGHPVDRYHKSGEIFAVEREIRQSSELDMYGKSGYLKTEQGSFIQVVIDSDEIEKLTEHFGYQPLVENLALNEGILYAAYIDENLEVTSHSCKEYIGMDLSEDLGTRSAIIDRETYSEEYLNKNDNLTIYNVTVPVMIDDKPAGALSLGYSMENVRAAVRMTNLNIYTLGALLLMILVIILKRVQKTQIIDPIKELGHEVRMISLEDNVAYRLPIKEEDPFIQLRKNANKLLDQAQLYFESMIENQEELFSSNEELQATLGQLTASEQQLMAQYDEISKQNKYIEFIANHDALTGLPNRREFTQILEESLEKGIEGAVLLLDIDNFKNINDALGHAYGDKVLQYVANLLIEVCCDEAVPYRFGGDEFLINIQNQSDIDENSPCIQSVLNCFNANHWIEGVENYIGVSTGIARYPLDGNQVEDLLMKADIAMHSAKKSGKNQHIFFGDHMTWSFLRKIKIEQALRKALEQEGFMLVYQPVIEMKTGEIKSFEALIRIRGSKFSAGEFIPIAEETRLILPIGRWVIKEAIGQLRKWKDEGYEPKAIAINLSPKQMEDTSLVEFLISQLKENNIDPSLIEMEITEGILLENKEKNIAMLDKIQSLGISISLDDFGTGYSSLNSLTYIPVNKVKIDKSLKDKFIYHESSQVIESIISLIHSLNLTVVIEGVEEVDEYRRLMTTGSDYLQGYLFSKPVDVSQVMGMSQDNYLSLIE